jgi:magnesium transporter
VQYRRVSSPVRDVAAALSRREVPWFSDQATEHLNDVYDHVLRISDLVEAQRDVLAGLLDAHLSNVNNRMNDVMKKTSSWGAILLVPTLIAGIYGMNFRHLPELDWVAGYPAALGLMGAASGVLYWRFKKLGWL